jgi:hypothetical protein
MMPSTTQFEFTLPKGLIDSQGEAHCRGIMRLSTAKDEIAIQKDRRVQESPAAAVLIRLSQVVIQLGSLPIITPDLLENLFILDLAYLREFYNQINQHNEPTIGVQCPQCRHHFKAELSQSGES